MSEWVVKETFGGGISQTYIPPPPPPPEWVVKETFIGNGWVNEMGWTVKETFTSTISQFDVITTIPIDLMPIIYLLIIFIPAILLNLYVGKVGLIAGLIIGGVVFFISGIVSPMFLVMVLLTVGVILRGERDV